MGCSEVKRFGRKIGGGPSRPDFFCGRREESEAESGLR